MNKYILIIFLILKIGCSSSHNFTYTLTDTEKELFFSIQNQDLNSTTFQKFDEDVDLTTLGFQQTIDVNSLKTLGILLPLNKI